MSFNNYFQSELIALRELGKEFAEANPSLAQFLDTPGRDPDVERILEGFAFLSGRLRQKLDDELPEITHSLFNLLWPNYLRQIPSGSIVQFSPMPNLANPIIIPRGTVVESRPVDGTACTYTTAYDIEIFPFNLSALRIVTRDGQSRMILTFKSQGVPLENIPLKKLRLFFTGEKALAHTIFYYLLRKTSGLEMVLPIDTPEGKKDHVLSRLESSSVSQVGFREEESLYPYPPNAFPGYRLLQEYFCFPDKFLFVDIDGLESGLNKKKLSGLTAGDSFELHFLLDDLPINFEAFKLSNFQLYCTPVVNIFPKSSTPLTLDYRQTEYRIVPDPRHPYHYSTYSVEKVESWEHDDGGEKDYLPFESFSHSSHPGQDAAYYRLRIRPSLKDDSAETYISMVQDKNGGMPTQSETVSLELLCTNRLLPLELSMGDICRSTDNTPETVSFKNITAVTPPCLPPLEDNLLWRLISNMSLNYIPLTNIHALRGILATYDFQALRDSRRAKVLKRMLSGILRVDCDETDRIHRGLPLRGAITRMRISKANFSCEGDMFLFSSIINEFLVMYATVNSFNQLVVIEDKSGEQYQWPARLGTQRL